MFAITRTALLSTATILTLALAPAAANAASISIDDLTDTGPFVVSDFGTFTPSSEAVRGSGQFISADPDRPAIGASHIFNVNLVSDGFFFTPRVCGNELTPTACLSDTLAVTLTGIDPAHNNGNNVSVSLAFVSDPNTPFLPGNNNVVEDGTFQHFSPLTDLNISLRSDCLENIGLQCVQKTPEPTSLVLLGAGLAVLATLRRRKAA